MASHVPKILFYNFGARLGGAENVLLTFLKASRGNPAPARYQVLLNETGLLADQLEKHDIPFHIIEAGAQKFYALKREQGLGVTLLRLIPSSIVLFFRVLRHIREGGFDLVVSNTYKSHLILGLAAYFTHIPVAWRFHDMVHAEKDVHGFSAVNLRLIRTLSRRVKLISVVSQAVKDSFSELGLPSGKVRVVHNGLSPAKPSQISSEDPPRQLVLGWIGQLTPWKGIEAFLDLSGDLIRMAEKCGRSLEIRIAGSPLFGEAEYETFLKDQVPTEFRSQVLFMGQLTDVDAFYEGLDVFFHTAIVADPFPTTVLEAASHGLLVVASPLGGAKEFVQHGQNGYICDIKDRDQVLKTFQLIFENPRPHLDMGSKLYERLIDHFSVQAYQSQLEREFLNVTSSGPLKK